MGRDQTLKPTEPGETVGERNIGTDMGHAWTGTIAKAPPACRPLESLVKYTIAGILLTAAGLLYWVSRTGTASDVAIMVIAIITVTFFASLGNLWNSMYRRKQAARKADLSNAVVIRSAPRPTTQPEDKAEKS